MEMFDSNFPNKMSATLLKWKAISFMHYAMPRNISSRPLQPLLKLKIPCQVY